MDTPEVKGAILMHMNSGKILYHKNMHERFAPASMSKMMGMLLLIERIQRGEIRRSDPVIITGVAQEVGDYPVAFQAGERVSVEDLVKCVMICSSNAAVVALAEHIAGTHEAFVDLMNAKARELRMRNTNFTNATGVAWPGRHFASPYNIALLSKALCETDIIFPYTSIKQDTIRHEDGRVEPLHATNPLLGVYPGVDGLKTGLLWGRGYSLSATLLQGKHRFIAVVMEAQTRKQSGEAAARMFDFALSLPEYQDDQG